MHYDIVFRVFVSNFLPSTQQASISKSSHEVPIFQTIQAGPYHCCALTDDGRLFTWGKGKFGVLGQNTEDNHYEPVQVVTEPGLPVQRFATGEYHSLAIVEADRLDMVDKGYRFRAIPNADDQVFIVEQSDIRQEDLKARFRTDENSPVERYNKEGRSAKGQFSNLIEVTEDGKFVLDKGLGKREEVGQDAIEPARALSVKGEQSPERRSQFRNP
jgi:alpha-tubulin suppressor-like RCC1 family protein